MGFPVGRLNLFVLGHMRSYSSVLCHILGSHPQIDGYCETHTKYRTRFDLLRLRSRVAKLTGEPLRGRYVLDKVLHNYPLASSILKSRQTLGLVLLRRPAPTVQSIVNMGLHYSDVAWYRDVDSVARYYEERLATLVRHSEDLRGRVLFVVAEDLLTRTAAVLHGISGWLQLSEPLEADYKRFSHTGEGGYGDPSEVITIGHVSNVDRPQRTTVILPAAVLARLEAAYAACSESLRERCEALAA
ncbi:MAG TPA: hypothetical protein VHB68_19535 [Steroidobacteraceae bacterium]|nr:hypothetical protein [Steroidobacteraceae bacterium]